MKTLLLILSALALVLCASAQTAPPSITTMPNGFAAAGLGFQQIATPQASGFAEVCSRNPDLQVLSFAIPTYRCLASDYSGDVTSARVDVDAVLYRRGPLAGGLKLGGGASYNGLSFGTAASLGGWTALDLSKVVKVPGICAVASVSWQRDAVSIAAAAGPASQALHELAARAVIRFGFGKAW